MSVSMAALEMTNPFNIVGTSDEIRYSRKMAEAAAQHDVNVLLLGESGVGKELFAQTIHMLSDRKFKKLVTINCSAIQDTLLESEIFGHTKGAFTGAEKFKIGKMEVANGGTLFLDEIGEMSITAQCKLLRALDNQTFERVGGVETIQVDVRIIAATNANLEEKVKNGYFRLDLFHRLNEFSIKIPPLRKRGEDIVILINYYLNVLCEKYGKTKSNLSPELMHALISYSWPGNVRELKHSLTQALISKNGDGNNLDLSHFHHLNLFSSHREAGSANISTDLREVVELAEKELVWKVLGDTGWNRKEAARRLKVSYKCLRNKLKKWGLEKPRLT